MTVMTRQQRSIPRLCQDGIGKSSKSRNMQPVYAEYQISLRLGKMMNMVNILIVIIGIALECFVKLKC